LRVLEARTKSGDIGALQRSLKGIKNDSIGTITNSMNVLMNGDEQGGMKFELQGVTPTTCQPSSKYLGMTSNKISGSRRMKPEVTGLSW
jgi:hypothetical protein